MHRTSTLSNTLNSFGSIMEGRSYEGDTSLRYRFGFNTQEKDDEVYGKGNVTTAEFWEYDARLGRRWNLDPIIKPDISLYSVFGNKPIVMIDPDGKTDYYNNKGKKIASDGINNGVKKLVLSRQTAKKIKAATTEYLKAINEDTYRDIVDMPSKSEVAAMQKSWNNTEKPSKHLERGHEEGFVSGGGNDIQESKPGVISEKPELPELNEVIKQRISENKPIKLVVHTHTPILTGDNYMSANPSGTPGQDADKGDFPNAAITEKETGNDKIEFAVIGLNWNMPNDGSGQPLRDFKPTVTYYDSKGIKGSIKLNKLEKAVNKARKNEPK
jgi:RHS repeat-associated protein